MFVIKLQYKESNEIMYSNESVIIEKAEVITKYDLKRFTLSLNKAKNLFKDLVMRNINPPDRNYGWYDVPKTIKWISIVELSNYEPYSEYQVVDYREFK